MAIKGKAQGSILLLLLDFAGLIGSFNLSYYLFHFEPPPDYAFRWFIFVILFISFALQYILNLNNFEENRSTIYIANRTFITGILLIVLTNTVLFFTPLRYQGGLIGRGIFSMAMFTYISWTGFSRWVITRSVHIKRSQDAWLIVSDSSTAIPFAKDLQHKQFASKYNFLLKTAGDKTKLVKTGVNADGIIGTWDALPVWRELQPKGIVLACSENQPINQKMQTELMKARLSGVRVYDLTDFYEIMWQKVPVLNINHKWFVLSHGFDLIHNPIGIRVKNLIDLFVAITGLVLASPIILLTALAVFLESGRPLIYKQVRTGAHGKPFTLYKFRSMKKDAEKEGVQWASQNDERVTFVGKVIRKLRFDELPQLFNILKGEMSFIGPRPERPEFDKMLESKIPYYNLRNSLKPGITGWAQVKYPYGASIEDAKEKLEYDIYYIKNYSLLLDLTILIRTIKVILHLEGR